MDTTEIKNERALKNKWIELKNRKEELLKTRCTEIANIPDGFNLSHTDCQFITLSQPDYCKTSCLYYKKRILPIEDEMESIRSMHPAFLNNH